MLFRSATLGYHDFTRNAGTENFGGIRPGCWINAFPAGGMVLVPEATAGCRCSYLNRAWIALVRRLKRVRGNKCQECGVKGRLDVRILGDHVIERKDGGAELDELLMIDSDELIAGAGRLTRGDLRLGQGGLEAARVGPGVLGTTDPAALAHIQ